MSFFEKVQEFIKLGERGERDKEDVAKWRETGATGTPLVEGDPGGFMRQFDPESGQFAPSAEEILEVSPEARERQQSLAMKYKGRGFPTVEPTPGYSAMDPRRLPSFTDGKPEDVLPRPTEEQMGFAEDEFVRPPGYSRVTGAIDPLEEAKLSKVEGTQVIPQRRMMPPVITDEFAEEWNKKHSEAWFKLTGKGEQPELTRSVKWRRRAQDEIKQIESAGVDWKKDVSDAVRSGRLTPEDAGVLLRGPLEGRRESLDIIREMSSGTVGSALARHKKSQAGLVGQRVGAGPVLKARERFKRGKIFEETTLPEWAKKDQVRPLWYNSRYTGRLLGEATWDEDVAARVLQAPGQLANFLSKHVLYIPALDERPEDRKLVRTSAPFMPLPSLHMFSEDLSVGAADVLSWISTPAGKPSEKVSRWMKNVLHVPKRPGGKTPDRPIYLYDAVQHFGPNLWEIGAGMSLGIYEGAQKYVNPFSRKNVWSSEKSLRQGMDEFTEGASNMTAAMLNSYYRSIPGVDLENMIRYQPLEVFLNLSSVKVPVSSAIRKKGLEYVRSAHKKRTQRLEAIRDYMKSQASGAPLGIMPPGWSRPFADTFKSNADRLAVSAARDLSKSRMLEGLNDALTLASAPANVFSPVEVASILVRRGFADAGSGFGRQFWTAPLTIAARSKFFALFSAIEREGLTHNRKTTLNVQELASEIRDITPAKTRAEFDKPASAADRVKQLSQQAPFRTKLDEALDRAGVKGVDDLEPTVPDDFAMTFNEMAWMEHEPLFFNDPSKDLVSVGADGFWRLTDVGKKKLQLGEGFDQSAVTLNTKQLRNEVAGKLAAMNVWGVDLAKKSITLSNEAISLGLFRNPAKLRQIFWSQLYQRGSLKKLSMEELSKREAGESIGVGASGPLLTNQLRKLDIPIEARLVRIGERIPEELISKHAKSAGEFRQGSKQLLSESMDAATRLSAYYPELNIQKGISPQGLVDSLKSIGGRVSDEHSALYKESLGKAERSVGAARRATRRENAVKMMRERNDGPDVDRYSVSDSPGKGKPVGPGGYGMDDDFFRTAIEGISDLSGMVAMHKIFKEAASHEYIAKSYNPGKGWMLMPDEGLYRSRYSKLDIAELKSEAMRLGVSSRELKNITKDRLLDVLDRESPKKFGDLSGKWVHEDVWFHVVNGQKLLDDMKWWYPKVLSMWKASKTAWSPQTTARNLITNIMYFAPMAGLSVLNPMNWSYYQRAIRDAFSNKKSKHWKDAHEDGVFQSTFMMSELGIKPGDFAPMQAVWKTPLDGIKEFIGLVDKVNNGNWLIRRSIGFGKMIKLPGILYSLIDDIFRQAYHHKYKGRIGRPKAASGAIEKFIDYKNVPGFVNVLRMPYKPYRKAELRFPEVAKSQMRSIAEGPEFRGKESFGMLQEEMARRSAVVSTPVESKALGLVHYVAAQPFISFTARAIPLTTEWLARNPIQAKIYMAIHDAMTAHGFAESGVTPEMQEGLYGMVAGMNKWERFKYAPAASIAAISSITEKTTGLSPAGGYGLSPGGVDEEERHLFLDTNFFNPFAFATPSMDPISNKGTVLSIFDYARSLGVGEHFLATPLMNAYGRAGRKVFDIDFAIELNNAVMKHVVPPLMPSPTDIASVFGAPQHGARSPRRFRGGPWVESLQSARHGWAERDEYVRPIMDKILGLAGVKTKRYGRTELMVLRARDFKFNIDKIKRHANQRNEYWEGVERLADASPDIPTRRAARRVLEKQGAAAKEEFLENAKPLVGGLMRVIDGMKGGRLKELLYSHSEKFLEEPTEESMDDLMSIVNSWIGDKKDLQDQRKIHRLDPGE